MLKPILYTGAGFDRAHHLRADEDWFAATLRDTSTRVVPVWRNDNLIHPGDGTRAPRAATLDGAGGGAVLARADHVVLLVVEDGVAVVAADVSSWPEVGPDVAPSLVDGARFMDLRQAGPLMDRRDGALLAFARGIAFWHRHHLFCGVCGSPTVSRQAGHVRRCANPACGREHFPRTDPAVIMLVVDGGRCLLGRQARWPQGQYSTLAGFVEPGESLEEAVAREVEEETGVRIAEARYRASQPWPFPASLMLGYRARAVTAEIRVNANELEDARWFTRAEVKAFDGTRFRLPRPDSISRWLIEEWLAEPD